MLSIFEFFTLFFVGDILYLISSKLNELINNKKINLERYNNYKFSFVEKKNNEFVLHPYNSWSSLIYFIIFLKYYNSADLYINIIVNINLILSIVSFLFHSTEIYIIGSIDIILVSLNTYVFLLYQNNVNYLLAVYILSYFAVLHLIDVYINLNKLDNCLLTKYKYTFIAPPTIAILYTMNGLYLPYILFFTAYLFKLFDTFLVSYNYTLQFQGTALYHIFTGIGILYKLQEIDT